MTETLQMAILGTTIGTILCNSIRTLGGEQRVHFQVGREYIPYDLKLCPTLPDLLLAGIFVDNVRSRANG